MEKDKITGTLDMYLLNADIAAVLKQYVFDDMGDFLEDVDAIKGVFGEKCTMNQASDYLKDAWIINP